MKTGLELLIDRLESTGYTGLHLMRAGYPLAKLPADLVALRTQFAAAIEAANCDMLKCGRAGAI